MTSQKGSGGILRIRTPNDKDSEIVHLVQSDKGLLSFAKLMKNQEILGDADAAGLEILRIQDS